MSEQRYRVGDRVTFDIYTDPYDGCTNKGEIRVAEPSWWNPDESMYDIRRDDGTWLKHVAEYVIYPSSGDR